MWWLRIQVTIKNITQKAYKNCPWRNTIFLCPMRLQSNYKTHLKVHTQKTHEATSYPCDQCDYNATTKLYLSVHTQESHTETVQKIKNNPGKVSSNSSSKTIHTTSQQRERTWRVMWKLFTGIEIIIIVSCGVSRHQRERTWRVMWKLFTRIEVYQLHVLRNIHIK